MDKALGISHGGQVCRVRLPCEYRGALDHLS